MARKIFEVTQNHYKLPDDHDDYWPEGEAVKCGGCNWKVSHVYLAADSQKEADELWAMDGNNRGLCGECLAEVWTGREL